LAFPLRLSDGRELGRLRDAGDVLDELSAHENPHLEQVIDVTIRAAIAGEPDAMAAAHAAIMRALRRRGALVSALLATIGEPGAALLGRLTA
jgi:hypothetical protein